MKVIFDRLVWRPKIFKRSILGEILDFQFHREEKWKDLQFNDYDLKFYDLYKFNIVMQSSYKRKENKSNYICVKKIRASFSSYQLAV